jgi:hypothetical protein
LTAADVRRQHLGAAAITREQADLAIAVKHVTASRGPSLAARCFAVDLVYRTP